VFTEQATTSIIVALFGFLTAVAGFISAYFMAKLNNSTAENTASTKRTEGVMAEVHTAVNSNHQAEMERNGKLIEKLDAQEILLKEQGDQITALKVLQATSQERQTPTAADGSAK
jgi:hypothetical protein